MGDGRSWWRAPQRRRVFEQNPGLMVCPKARPVEQGGGPLSLRQHARGRERAAAGRRRGRREIRGGPFVA